MKTEIVKSEEARFRELAGIVSRGLETFAEVGQALMELRDGKSYKAAGYATFEECCDKAFGISRPQAYRMIGASSLAVKMSPIGDIPNEGVARELLTIKDETKQLEVAKRAAEIAGGRDIPITSAHVKQAKAEIVGVKPATKEESAPASQVIEAQAEVVPTISIAANYILAASESELAKLFSIVGPEAKDKVVSALELEWDEDPAPEGFVGPMRSAWLTEETSPEQVVAIITSLFGIEKSRKIFDFVKKWLEDNGLMAQRESTAADVMPTDYQPDTEMLELAYHHGLSSGDRTRLFHRGTDPGKRWNVIKELPPHKGVHTMSNLGKELSQPYVEAFGRGVSVRNAATSTPDQP